MTEYQGKYKSVYNPEIEFETDYIAREATRDLMYHNQGPLTEYELNDLPPADVRPVVRGRWEMDSDGIPHCTECGCAAPQRLFLQVQSLACTTRFIMSNYCHDCGSYNGADMRGGDTNGDEKD